MAKSIEVLAGFNSFIVQWDNILEQTVNIYVDMSFSKPGQTRDLTWVLTSNKAVNREIIDDVVLSDGETLHVKVRIGDTYGTGPKALKWDKSRL